MPCRHFARNSCMKGNDCPYDHGLSKYPCNNYTSTGFCSRGADCLFSHKQFRKIDSVRCEFANEYFQRGKKHLLKNIKRRNYNPQIKQGVMHTSLDSTKNKSEAELEKLRSQQNATNGEIMMLRQQQEDTRQQLASLKHHLDITKMKQKHIILILMGSLKDQMFVQNFIEKMKKKRAPVEILKKRRLNSCDSGDDNLFESPKTVGVGEINGVIVDDKIVLSSDESSSYLLNHNAKEESTDDAWKE